MKWLSAGGAVAAGAVGAATLWGQGWRGGVLLLAFFLTSTFLTRSTERQRAARQVLANGGVAALAALLGSWPAFAGALAAATSDTWATEVGARSRTPPRLLTSAAVVPHGTSGGITALGTAAGVGGAALIGALAAVLEPRGVAAFDHSGRLMLAIAGAGVAGMLLDSLLGATVQGAEQRGVRLDRGYGWLDNDAVNLAATTAGAALAWAAAS